MLLLLSLAGCSPAPSGPITPVVSSAGVDPDRPDTLEAWGTVSGIAETGGTCRFTFHAGNGAASRLTAKGTSAGDHTDCGPVHEATYIVGSGSFRTTLRYESLAGETFESADFEMTIP